jgi:hypothetical protein
MPRPMSPAMLTGLTQGLLQPALFVSIAFANETLYIWSGIGSITWNGETWLGVGNLGGISMIEDGTTLDARGITITLSGIDSTALAEALQNLQIALPVTIYFGLFSSGSLIADPFIAWQGRTDRATIDVSGETSTIALQCESRLLDMDISPDRRYTLEDSQIFNPGDLGMQFVSSITLYTIIWGFPISSTNV